MRALRILGPCLLLAPLACHSPGRNQPRESLPVTPDVALSQPPFSEVHCAYKERLEQPYVCLEVTGSYAIAGRRIPELAHLMQEQGLAASGPPFGLYFDDPGLVPVERLRARVAFPVASTGPVRAPLIADALPGATVAYAVAAGAYPEVPRCYPGLLSYVKKMHWQIAGPIREIYLVDPGSVSQWSALRCEVQVPVSMAP